MCDLAGGVTVIFSREGPAGEIGRVAVARAGEAYGAVRETSLDEELDTVPANVREGDRAERRRVDLPFAVERLNVPLGAEQAFVDDVRREYLELIIDHPETMSWLADPRQRLVISPNWRLHASGVSDPVRESFTIGHNHATYLAQLGLTSPTYWPAVPVIVAVLDNGFDDKYWLGSPLPVPVGSGMDLIPGGSGESGHGTLVAALVAASAPGATVQPIRIGGQESTEWDAIHGLARAVQLGADVITLSYQQLLVDVSCGTCGLVRSAARSEVFEKMIDWAISANGGNRAVLVAAGNSGIGLIARPAASPGAIPVTALDANGGALAWFANYDSTGRLPVIAVPGEAVAEGAATGMTFEGTSFAAGYAAALYAEAMMRWGTLDAQQVTSLLCAGGANVGTAMVPALP